MLNQCDATSNQKLGAKRDVLPLMGFGFSRAYHLFSNSLHLWLFGLLRRTLSCSSTHGSIFASAFALLLSAYVIPQAWAENTAPVPEAPADATVLVGEIYEQVLSASDDENDFLSWSAAAEPPLPAWLTVRNEKELFGFAGGGTAVTRNDTDDEGNPIIDSSPDGTTAKGADIAIFSSGQGIHAIDGRVFFTDVENYGVRYIDQNGKLQTFYQGDGFFTSLNPGAIQYDPDSDTIYIGLVGGGGGVVKSQGGGPLETVASGLASASALLLVEEQDPENASLTNRILYVGADDEICRIDLSEDPLGCERIVGDGSTKGFSNGTAKPDIGTGVGTASQALVNTVSALALDQAGRLLFVDRTNRILRRVDLANDSIETIAGQQGVSAVGGNDGPAIDATFKDPTGMVIDDEGRIFITERLDNPKLVRVIDTDGTIRNYQNWFTSSGRFLSSLSISENKTLYLADDREIVTVNSVATLYGIPTSEDEGAYPISLDVSDDTDSSSVEFTVNVVPANTASSGTLLKCPGPNVREYNCDNGAEPIGTYTYKAIQKTGPEYAQEFGLLPISEKNQINSMFSQYIGAYIDWDANAPNKADAGTNSNTVVMPSCPSGSAFPCQFLEAPDVRFFTDVATNAVWRQGLGGPGGGELTTSFDETFSSNLIEGTEDFTFYRIQGGDIPLIDDWAVTENGTVVCPNEPVGSTKELTINGQLITFTKRDRAGIDALLAGDPNSQELETTCTSDITIMSTMFRNNSNFNRDISSWDVSSVTNMGQMFNGASAFNQDISDWDTSSVTDMRNMFEGATLFNQPIGSWDVGAVTNAMSGMFRDATAFNQPLNDWDVSNVENMSSMFQRATSFNQDLSDWKLTSVGGTGLWDMFNGATSFNQSLDGWISPSNSPGVETLVRVFQGATAFNQDLSSWNTADIESFQFLFDGATSFNQNLSSWDVSSLDRADGMFKGVELSVRNYDALLTAWEAQLVENDVTFDGGLSKYSSRAAVARQALIDDDSWTITDGGQLPAWSVASDGIVRCSGEALGSTQTLTINDQEVTFTKRDRAQIEQLLSANQNNPELATTCTSGITDMSSLFKDNLMFDQDISHWDVSFVTTMESMFQGANSNKTTFNQDISAWDVSSVTNMKNMFANAHLFDQPIGSWDVSSVTDMQGMFNRASSFNADISDWTVSNVTNMESMFAQAENFNQPLNDWDVSSVTNMVRMFSVASSFNQDLNNWDVSAVTNMQRMFVNAVEFDGDISSWNVSNVTDMSVMFAGAESFDRDISEKIINSGQPEEYTAWDVSMVTTMGSMFSRAASFNQDIGNWNTSSVTDMGAMFDRASAFDQDIGTWNVTALTNASAIFSNVALSVANYEALLAGWAGQAVQSGVTFSGGDSRYTSTAQADRTTLTSDPNNWTITDGGLVIEITDQASLNSITDLSADYLLSGNVTIDDPTSWTPLGSTEDPFTGSIESADVNNPFTISGLTDEPLFDVIGPGAKISGITINASNSNASAGSGLLANKIEGAVDNKAEISLITITSTSAIDGGSNNQIGGLAGTANHAIFTDITIDGDVSGGDEVGAVSGSMSNGTVTNITVGGQVSGTGTNVSAVAGSTTDSPFTGLTVNGSVSGGSTTGGIVNGSVALAAADLTLAGNGPKVTGEVNGTTGSSVMINLESNGATYTTDNTIDVNTLTHQKGQACIGHTVTTETLVFDPAATDPSASKLTIEASGEVTTTTLTVKTENSGRVVVAAGGQLTATNATVASTTSQNQSGGVTVEGESAQWTNTGNLTIGRTGTDNDGQVLIADGGQVIGQGATLIKGTGEVRVSGSESVFRVDASGNEGEGTLTLEETGRLTLGAQSGVSTPEDPGVLDAAKLKINSAGTLTFNHTDTDYVFEPVIEGQGVINIFAGTTELAGGFTQGSGLGQIQIQSAGTLKIGADQILDADHFLNWIGGAIQLGVTNSQNYGQLSTNDRVSLPANPAIDVVIADCNVLDNGTVLPAVIESTSTQPGDNLQNASNASFQVTDNCADFSFEAVVNGQAVDLNATKLPSAVYTEGDGSVTDPYQISNWEQLATMGQLLDKYFVLTASLDKNTPDYAQFAGEASNNGAGFLPIGTVVLNDNFTLDEANSELFTGSLEGAGFSINDLIINIPTGIGLDGAALFSGLGSGATIKNLSLDNASITGDTVVAGLVGYNNQGNITNVSVKGQVKGSAVVAGLAAIHVGDGNDGIIRQASANVIVEAANSAAGGLVAFQSAGQIIQSYAQGQVTGAGLVGGLVAENGGSITQSYAKNDVSGTGDQVGGLVGAVGTSGTPQVTASFWDQEISGQTNSAGGEGATTEQMTSFEFYDNAWNDGETTTIIRGWADATDSSVTAVWGQCAAVNDGYPFQLIEYSSDPCVITGLEISVTPAGNQLKNIPFAVTVTAISSFGAPIAVDEALTIALSAQAQGEAQAGTLGVVGSDQAPSLTLTAGQSDQTLEGVFFSGLSDPNEMGDIELKATAELGEETLSATLPLSVRDIAFSVTADETESVPLGEQVTITATLLDLDDQPVVGQVTTFTTTLGVLRAGESSGQTITVNTNNNGQASAILTSDTPGDAEVVARCPGACPVTTTVTFIALTPSEPTLTAIEERDGALILAFEPPVDLGGGTLSNYEYQLNGGDWVAFDPAITSSPATIGGLTNGTDYSVRIRAVSDGGAGDPSGAKTGNPFTAPSAPTVTAIEETDGALIVAFSPPVDLGGRPLSNYEYQLNNGDWVAFDPAITSSPATIRGLSNGTDYSVKLRAVTVGSAGGGEASSVGTGNPFTAPSTPENVEVSARPGGLRVSWDPSTDNGGREITTYRVLINGEVACEVSASESGMACDIDDLSSDQAYAVQVVAVTDVSVTPTDEDNQVEVTPKPIIPVPTLSLWALFVLMLGMAILSYSRLRRV